MSSTCGLPIGDDPSVLVVYVNFAVGAALARRLMGLGTVELASAELGPRRLAAPCRFDAVLLCPYLPPAARDALLDAWEATEPRPALLELEDEVGNLRVAVLAGGARRLEPLVAAVGARS